MIEVRRQHGMSVMSYRVKFYHCVTGQIVGISFDIPDNNIMRLSHSSKQKEFAAWITHLSHEAVRRYMDYIHAAPDEFKARVQADRERIAGKVALEFAQAIARSPDAVRSIAACTMCKGMPRGETCISCGRQL